MTQKKPNAAQKLMQTLGKNQVWMQIQCTTTEPQLDGNKAFVLDDKGGMMYRPNADGWLPLRPEDIPEWVKDDKIIAKLHAGEEVSWKPEDGGRWYRGVVTTPAAEVAH